MRLALMLVAAAALAACGGLDPVAEEVENGSELPELNQSSASPAGGAPAEGTPAGNTIAFSGGNIPSELWGRWGLSPGDCDSPLGKAEGLLIVESDELRFYESKAVPAANVQTSSNSISGDFAFTGEGQQWTKHVSLELRDNRLVRTERDPIAGYRYVRCE